VAQHNCAQAFPLPTIQWPATAVTEGLQRDIRYAELGDKDQAFQWFNTAFQAHDEGLVALKTDFALDAIRSDPRFADLVRKMGLPQ
jgi:hypothetical protein